MRRLFSAGMILIAFLCCNPSAYSQSLALPEFVDSKEEFLKEVFGLDICTIGVGYDSKREYGVDIITNYLNFSWYLNEDSDPKNEELFKNKFKKLMDTAPIRINNIGNYNVLQLTVYKGDNQVY